MSMIGDTIKAQHLAAEAEHLLRQVAMYAPVEASRLVEAADAIAAATRSVDAAVHALRDVSDSERGVR